MKSEAADFFVLKNEVMKILGAMRQSNVVAVPLQSAQYEYGVDVQVNGKSIGNLGKVAQAHLKTTEVRQPVFYAELDWDYLIKKYKNELSAVEIPKFPEVRRDLSLVIDKSVSFETIKNLALKNEKKLLKSINVFDVFESEKLGTNKKSYSISFILQDYQQTLQDKVIDKSMNRLIEVFETELGAVIRK